MDKKNIKEEYYKENIEPYLKSKGFQKMWNYFIEITKTDYFVNFIKDTRAKYGIPAKGFGPDDDNSFYIPPKGFNKLPELHTDIVEKVCKKFKLHYFDYLDVVELYVLYDILQPLADANSCGLFRISDVVNEKEDPFGELFQQSDDMAYPVAIRISPYASQRDLVDFIKNKAVKKIILSYQDKYRVKDIRIGKVRSKKDNIQRRNEFIYQNKGLPRKQIMRMVTDKFKETLDYGHIGKIVSLEIKKRKEV